MDLNLSGSAPHTESIELRKYPQIIKYMGSKAKIVGYVANGINDVFEGGTVCDLFSGSCTLAGAIGGSVDFHSNDIQNYSSVLARCYLGRVSRKFCETTPKAILNKAEILVKRRFRRLPSDLKYTADLNLCDYNEVEKANQELIKRTFGYEYHLFLKFYSGTWWSALQCLWIDCLREVIDKEYSDKRLSILDRSILLAAVMNAMAYCGQGTGHFAQFRDAKDQGSLKDILIYRVKSVPTYFGRCATKLFEWNSVQERNSHKYSCTNLDYLSVLKKVNRGVVYADPPYAFVHYSRFYHALETFVLYDYPEMQEKNGSVVKGRYRSNRHQSPFSIRSQVPGAFEKLFLGVREAHANMVLSYSNSGLFELDDLVDLVEEKLSDRYAIDVQQIDYRHMTMGRRDDRDRRVKEALILAKIRS